MPAGRCPVCKSKKWHKVGGIVTCSEGHVLQNYRNETLEKSDGQRANTLNKRTLKAIKRTDNRIDESRSNIYYGERARYHYYQCRQLILRQQVKRLIELWKLPAQFEIICRDLWATHLSCLPNPPSPEPYLFTNEIVPNTARTSSSSGNKNGEEESLENLKDEAHSSGSETDDAIAELMQQNSESDSDSMHPVQNSNIQSNISSGGTERWWRGDSSSANIALLVIACWILRVPVVYTDFIKLIKSYELPYLDPFQFLLDPLTKHLAKHMKAALTPLRAPSVQSLHSQTSILARNLHLKFGIVIPEWNVAPILWRIVRDLGGSAGLYVLTKSILRDLSVPMIIHVPGIKRKRNNAGPEMILYAVTIMALKIIYGVDDTMRSPQDNLDPVCSMPCREDIKIYMDEHYFLESRTELLFKDFSRCPLEYEERHVDRYLSFCENALLGPQAPNDNVLDEFFAFTAHAQDRNLADNSESRKPVLRSVKMEGQAEAALFPGQRYSIYAAKDILGVLPPSLQNLTVKAAASMNAKPDEICCLIERLERQLLRRCEEIIK